MLRCSRRVVKLSAIFGVLCISSNGDGADDVHPAGQISAAYTQVIVNCSHSKTPRVDRRNDSALRAASEDDVSDFPRSPLVVGPDPGSPPRLILLNTDVWVDRKAASSKYPYAGRGAPPAGGAVGSSLEGRGRFW
jgi:hypothetical protein